MKAPKGERWSPLGQHLANAGLLLFSVFAPHSIAAAEISLAIVAAGWLVRTISTGKTGLHRSRFDVPVWLFFLWTVGFVFRFPGASDKHRQASVRGSNLSVLLDSGSRHETHGGHAGRLDDLVRRRRNTL